MPRFQLNIVAKTIPNATTPTKDILRGIIRAQLSPLKVKTSAYESTGPDPYTALYVEFTDESVSGYKDWSMHYLQGILDEFKANGIQPYMQHSSPNLPPPLIKVRVQEKIEVRGF